MAEQRKVLDSYSESEIEEAFLAAFAEKAAYNYVNSYSINVERDYDDNYGMKVIVEIGSMAGTPTKKEFDALEDMKNFGLTFVTGAKANVGLVDIIDYNAMEYHAVYAEVDGPAPKIADDATSKEDETTLSGSEL